MLYKNLLGLLLFSLFLSGAVNATALSVTISSSPVLPSNQVAGNVVTFGAVATGGSGTYTTYNFLVFNTITNVQVGFQSGTSNSFAYTVNGMAGDTQAANVFVLDSGGNSITSTNTGTLTVVSSGVAMNPGVDKNGVAGSGTYPALPALYDAGNFTVLAETAISTAGSGVDGNIGISPAATSGITGFGSMPLVNDPTGEYATSPLVTGRIYGADMTGTGAGAGKTPAMLTTATTDMTNAYTETQGTTAPAPVVDKGAGSLGGLTLAPGLYTFSEATVIIPTGTTLTLDCGGNSAATYIFDMSGAFTMDSGATVVLTGGCQAQNIYWAVAGQVTLGTTTQLSGVVLSSTSISINTGATLDGLALAQAAVSFAGTTGTGASVPVPVSTTTTVAPTTTTSGTTNSGGGGGGVQQSGGGSTGAGGNYKPTLVSQGNGACFEILNFTQSGTQKLLLNGDNNITVTMNFINPYNVGISVKTTLGNLNNTRYTLIPGQFQALTAINNYTYSVVLDNISYTPRIDTAILTICADPVVSKVPVVINSAPTLVTLTVESNVTTTGQLDTVNATTTSSGPVVILVNGTVVATGVKLTTFNAAGLSAGTRSLQACDIGTVPAVCSLVQVINVIPPIQPTTIATSGTSTPASSGGWIPWFVAAVVVIAAAGYALSRKGKK